VLFALTFILQVASCAVIALFNNEVRPSHTDALTRLDSNLELKLLLIRVKLVLISHHTAAYPIMHWLTLVVSFLVAVFLVRNYNALLPFYNKRVSVTYCACCLGFLWVVSNAILAKVFSFIAYEGHMVVVILGLVFLAYPSARYVRNRRVAEIMVLIQQEKIKDDLELDQFVSNFEDFVREADHNLESQMMFLGFLFLHKEECINPSCPLRNNTTLYLPLTDSTTKRDLFPSQDKILHQHFIQSIYMDFQRAHANNLSS